MFQSKVFIFKIFCSPFVDAHGPGPIPVQKVSPLNHEVLDYPVKWSIFEANRPPTQFELPCAELPEIFSGLRHNVSKKLNFNASGGEAPDGDVEKNHWVVRMPQTILSCQ